MAENNRLTVENRKVTSENYWLMVESNKINEKNVPAQTKNIKNEGLLKVSSKGERIMSLILFHCL